MTFRRSHATQARTTCRLALTGTVTAYAALIVWDLFHHAAHLDILVGLMLVSAAAVAAVFFLIDNWAARYAQAFEVGYRLRDVDDGLGAEMRLPVHRHLQSVGLPSEPQQRSS